MWTIAALAGGLCHQGDTTGQWAGDACVDLCIKGSPEELVRVPYPSQDVWTHHSRAWLHVGVSDHWEALIQSVYLSVQWERRNTKPSR